ncbi:MFS general substrate transporter, partial [Rhodotorula sp. JG-1b]
MVLPIYLAEIAPSEFRGRVVASMVVLITGGQVLAYVIGASFFHVTKGWRWMFGLGAVPAISQVLLSFSIPESPRYHLRKGRVVTAQKTIQRLNPSWSHEMVQKRIQLLRAEVQDHPGDRAAGGPGRQRLLSGWREKVRNWRPSSIQDGKLGLLWKDRANRRALLVACGLQFFQQATGFNTLMYYAAKIIDQTGLGQPAAFAVFIAVSNFISTIVALRLIDRVGRRTLLLRTLLGMIGGMALLSFAFLFIHVSSSPRSAASETGASPWAFVAVFAMGMFCVSYALGLGNVAWVVQSEVFNQELRAFGNAAATAVNWSANLIVSSTFLHLSHAATPAGAFGIYAIVAGLAWLFTWEFLPETKGLTLEEVRAVFEREVNMDG